MVKETRRRQLVARFNAHHRQKNSDRLLLAVADLLIALGEGLKRRHCRQPLLVTATCRKS